MTKSFRVLVPEDPWHRWPQRLSHCLRLMGVALLADLSILMASSQEMSTRSSSSAEAAAIKMKNSTQFGGGSFRQAAFFACGWGRKLHLPKIRKFPISVEMQLSATAAQGECSSSECAQRFIYTTTKMRRFRAKLAGFIWKDKIIFSGQMA